MPLYTLIFLLLIGIAAGFLSGSMGVGGAIVVIPGLVYLLGMSQASAQGTSLAMMLPPITLLAAINYYKSGYINLKVTAILVVAFVIGTYFGSIVILNVPERIMKLLFGMLLVIVGLKYIIWK